MIRQLLMFAGLFFAMAVSSAETNRSNSALNVRDFGAKGDGAAKDTAAFQRALDACAKAGGGSVTVPAGFYLIGSISIGSNTTLRLESRANLIGSPDIADYPLTRIRWEGEFAQGHRALICSEHADRVAIVGSGSIFGPPISVSRLRNPRGPALIEISEGKDVLLEGFTTQYQQLWSIHVVLCEKLAARNLTIRAVNFNGDGIDVDSCRDVLIERCDINTGDDAISLKSGRGMEAVRLGKQTENVTIRDCTLASSIFAAIGIGSEMSGGIRNVRLENCVLSGRQNGILIKSRDGRGGFIENLSGENLTLQNSPTFLAINLLNKGIQATEPVQGETEKWASVRNLSFKDIRVSNIGQLIIATNIPPEKLIDGLAVSNVTGYCRKGIVLANMTNVNLSRIAVTGFQGPLITKRNVFGSGLDGPFAPAAK